MAPIGLCFAFQIVGFLWFEWVYSKTYAPNSQNYKIDENLFIQCQGYSLVSNKDESNYQVRELVKS